MRKINCDVCGMTIEYASDVIQITVNDGEHPHNGSAMYKDIDCCPRCINKILAKHPVRIYEELETLQRY